MEERICERCGCVIGEDDNFSYVDEDIICEECAATETVICAHCGDRIWARDAVSDDSIYLCQDCYDDHYRRCEGCGRLIDDNDVYWHNDLPYCCSCYDDFDDDGIEEYHFETLGLYVYASTKSILDNALRFSGLTYKKREIEVTEGDILEISPDGKISQTTFEIQDDFRSFFNPFTWRTTYTDWYGAEESGDLLMEYCKMFGVSEEDVELLLEYGYDADAIEEMLMDTTLLEETLAEIRSCYYITDGGDT